MSIRARVALLYPTRDAGEDDFLALARQLRPTLDVRVVYVAWPGGVDDLALMDIPQVITALRGLGSAEHLARVLPEALEHETVDAMAFAVTSASFLDGPDGVARQLRAIQRITATTATSTTAAFQQAIRHLGLHSVSLASVYHPAISEHFITCMRDTGVEFVSRVDASAGSDRELAAWRPAQIVELVGRAAHPDAQAVLLPETALHTSSLTRQLEQAAGCPVLTATQVTLWAAARLVDLSPTATHAGPLFRPGTR
jgi:maleate cis-trans isomerase